ncbi:MAG: histidine kinase [Candidatus Omnitrophica bacterium]|nr:histidine kinase [Candidatus Omnitrophota bacterium]
MAKNGLIRAVAWIFLGLLAAGIPAWANASFEADNPYIIDSWSVDDGLPQSTVTSILQSRDGYLWFGTINGLVRFDGQRFTVFDEYNTPGLNSSWIVQLFEDSQGRLWIGTETAGVVMIKDGQVNRLGIGQAGAETAGAVVIKDGQAGRSGIGQATSEKRLASVCEDSEGAVWLYTADGQIWRYGKGRFDNTFLFGQGFHASYRAIIAEPSGPVWVATDRSQSAVGSVLDPGSIELPIEENMPVRRLDYLLSSPSGGYWRLADGRVQKCRTNTVERDFGPYPWGSAPVRAACEDRQGNLVVGTQGSGVFWFDDQGRASRLSTKQGLSSDVILALCVDREGNLWVGTDGGPDSKGLNRVKRRSFAVLDVSRGPFGNAVQSACEDDQGGLWIGSIGGGITYWKGSVQQHYGFNQGLASTNVWSVYVARNGDVWAGTWGAGLFRFQKQNGLFQRAAGPEATQRFIHAIYQDHSGALWVGTQNGLGRLDTNGWTMFTSANGLSADEVQAIAEDDRGNLWIGTVGGGLNRLHDGQFSAYHKQDGLPSEDISALYVDRDGILWIGTSGSGLARWQDGKVTRLTTRDGLLSNSINFMIQDDHGCLWIGSNAGIMRVQKRELNDFAAGRTTFVSCRAYGKPDGLPTRECTFGSQPAGCLGRDGRLWFPTSRGLVTVDPTQLHPNIHPPPVIIESVLINGQLQNTNALCTEVAQPVVIPPGKERLEIRYTSLNLSAAERARFKYRLEGHETDWTQAGNSHVARYSRLPPGRYNFQVKACNEDGVWNETGSTLALIVEPPYWRTWWFLSLSTACILGMIIGIVHYLSTQKLQRQLERLAQQEALSKDRSRIAQDIHDQLGASLTQVSLLSEIVQSDKDNPGEVESHARQIYQTTRETTRVLDEIVWAVNPSNDTLDSLVSYACKYAQDFLSMAGLRYRLDVPTQLPAIVIPPEFRHNVFLAFREAITNVVRHAAASSVWIRLRLDSATFILEIEDNGRGIRGLDEKAARTRNGLRNMRRRMEGIGGSFALDSGPEGGALVRLTAPLGT